MNWATGITTVWQRGRTYFPRTMQSIANAGFVPPCVFIDEPRVGTFGRWYVSLAYLWVKYPTADVFAMFQDDVELCKNTRQYIERCGIPSNRYLNLVTHPSNENEAPASSSAGRGGVWFVTRARFNSLPLANGLKSQAGRGACALVFPRSAVMELLKADRMLGHPQTKCATSNLDGAIVESLNAAGYQEMAHWPTLGNHIGIETSIPGQSIPQQPSKGFPGTQFDALQFGGNPPL